MSVAARTAEEIAAWEGRVPKFSQDATMSPRPVEIAWAAGFLEGEGTFLFNPGGQPNNGSLLVTAVQLRREPLERLMAMFGGSLGASTRIVNGERRAYPAWRAYGSRAAGIIFAVYGFMSPRRKEQIRIALSRWRRAPGAKWRRPWCDNGHPKREYQGRTVSGHSYCRACCRDREREKRANARA